MNWEKAIFQVIGSLLTIILGFIAWQSTNWTQNIQTLSDNVGQLNVKMEVVVTEISNYKEGFRDHEDRLRALESRVK